jgi:hypothetical protein
MAVPADSTGAGLVAILLMLLLAPSGAAGQTTILAASADSYLKSGSPNQNEGTADFLRIQSTGNNRSLVQFDPVAIVSGLAGASLVSARLELFIDVNSGNWGPDGRMVDAHRLINGWTESGATWNCPEDTNPSNGNADCAVQWGGGSFEEEPSDSVLHTGDLTGWISFDVTADVAAFLDSGAHYGWLIKKSEEGQNGRVDYASRESDNGPRLTLVTESAEHDETPPRLAITSPAQPILVNETSPAIRVEYADGGTGVDIASLEVRLDGTDMAASCTVDGAVAVCTSANLAPGSHSVEASLSDHAGNLATASRTFELLTGPGLHTVRLPLAADTYLRQGAPNQNQGSETVLRLQQSGKNRSLLRLDPAEVASLLEGATVHSARLELFIADNGSNWGPAARTIDLHAVSDPWSEFGATWNCADDADPADQQPGCSPQWGGGSFEADPVAGVLITSDLTGWVDFDVTAGVAAIAEGADHDGWLLKKGAEGQSGRVEFVSREGGAPEQPAVVVVFETDGGVDQVPPVITPLAPATGGFVGIAKPTVSAHLADAGSGIDVASVTVQVDGSDVTAEAVVSAEGVVWTAAAPLSEGEHAVEISAADLAGNPSTAGWSFTIDLTQPSVAVVEPGAGVVVGSATPAILVTYDDALSGVDLTSLVITVDGVSVTASCAVGPDDASCTAPPLAAGDHTVRAEVHDRAGNGRVAERSFVLVLDAEAPVVTITAPVAGASVNTPSVEVTGTATDDGSLVLVLVNGVEAALTGDQFAATVALEEGFNALLVVALDAVGNEGVVSRTVVLDTLPPEIRLERPASGQLVNGATVRVAGEVIDNRGVATVGVNGESGALADGRFEVTVPVTEGPNLLTVTAIDLAGNVAEATREVTRFTVPVVAITSPEDLAYIAATTVTVTGTVSEGVVSVTVNGVAASLSGTTFEAEGVPLIEGGNTVTATADGTLGRVATDTIHVVRDLTPPRVAVYRPASGEVVHTPAVAVSGLVNDIVPGTVNESEAGVTVNGVTAQVSNRSFFAPAVSLVPGENVLVVTAVDASGNTATTEVRVHFEPPAGARLRMVSGDQQAAEIGTALPEPLVVELLDAAGQSVPGRQVAFYLRGNNGSLEDGRRRVVVSTDGSGRAEASFTLGTRAGVANQVVEAFAPGFGGPVAFVATALSAAPAEIVVDSGGLQVGVAGHGVPRPLIAAVIDSGHNRIEGVLVRFRVVKGAGRFANGAQELEVATDSDGRAIVAFTLDPEEGIANNVVEANIVALEDGPKASFVASGRAAGPAEETSISGVVLDNTNLAIAGATLRVKGTLQTGVTDAEGQFRIDQAPVGAVKLIVDGSTVDRPGSWPDLEFDLVTIPGRDNTVNMPIYLLPLDLGSGLVVDETHGGTLTLQDFPGFALEIAPGSVTLPGGGRSGHVSVTVVHNDKVPMVPNFGQQPRMIVTIQPAGARFEPPARLTLPNVEGLVAGQVTEMYSFDHDLGHFVSIGTATVSDDATVIVADPGVGIVKAGWHCGGDPAVFGTAHDCPECEICTFNHCVGIDGVECTDDGDLCTLDGCSGGGCIHTPKPCDDCTSCFLGDCLADPGEEGNLCNDNPCTRCDNGLCDPVLDGPITASANGASFVEAETEEPISFMVTYDETECPEGATVRWNLGDGSFVSGNPATYAYHGDGLFTISAEVRCPPCPAKRTASAGVGIYEVQMKLEKIETTISDDGRYSEDTEVRVTAVKSTSGEQLFDFTGTVSLAEISGDDIFQQNGGELPDSVELGFSGTTTFVAKSLAGPQNNGSPPVDALLVSTSHAVFGEEPLLIPQWVDERVLHNQSRGPVYDWAEARARDIYATAGGAVLDALSAVDGYSQIASGNAGNTPRVHSAPTTIEINPHFLQSRLNSPSSAVCGQTKAQFFANVLVHEARHAYQNLMTIVDLQSPDDLPNAPNNDDDQDYLVDVMLQPPVDIMVDTAELRTVCSDHNDNLFEARYLGDGASDDPNQVTFASEMDAHVFDSVFVD